MSATTVIRIRNLDLKYGELSVLENLNVSIDKAEFVSLLGPSGCGKSTLLRCIAGLKKPASGTLEVTAAKTGLMFQKPLLLPWRTALQNVLLPIEIELGGGTVSNIDRQKARNVLRLVQLSGFENSYPNQLSGGMQQRVALARALITDPEILLLDEPFGALDEMTREKLNEQLFSIWNSAETRLKTIVMVTHSISEAVSLSNRIFIFAARPARLLDTVTVELSAMQSRDSAEFLNVVSGVRRIIREAE